MIIRILGLECTGILAKVLEVEPIFGAYRRSAKVKDGELVSLAKEIAKLCEDLQKQWNNRLQMW